MPLPLKKVKRTHTSVQHPYSIKINTKLFKLDAVLNSIYDLADGNLLVTNAETGLTDFSINECFAKKLEEAAKHVAGLANSLSEKVLLVTQRLDEACDRKVNIQDVIFSDEITDYKQKCPKIKRNPHVKFVPSQDFHIKTEWISDDESDGETSTETFSGKVNGHLTYPKDNENLVELHSFVCDHCGGVYQDRNELRNHYTNHRLEFFQCLVCDKIYRSVRAFEVHKESHDKHHVCLVCQKSFKLKSTLTNHAQVHSEDCIHCSHPGCEESFKHRQNQLEHIKWGHRDGKTCLCKICRKMFQTPTNMQTHSHASDLIPSYPLTQTSTLKQQPAKHIKKTTSKKMKKELTSKNKS